MKRFARLVIALCLTGKVWAQSSTPTPSAQAANAITPQEWQELREARNKALHDNPDLVTANQKLMEKMRDFGDKLDAAMIKADPTMVPIIAKFEAGRHLAAAPSPASSASQSPAR